MSISKETLHAMDEYAHKEGFVVGVGAASSMLRQLLENHPLGDVDTETVLEAACAAMGDMIAETKAELEREMQRIAEKIKEEGGAEE